MEHPPYDSGSHILARLKNQVQYREMLPVNTQPGLLKKSDES
jgi:hypothetical protein